VSKVAKKISTGGKERGRLAGIQKEIAESEKDRNDKPKFPRSVPGRAAGATAVAWRAQLRAPRAQRVVRVKE